MSLADLERLFRDESGRIVAVLIRLLGDFDLAEEVMQEAFAAALDQWPTEGAPASPRAWLIATAKHKAIDRLRRRTRLETRREELERLAELERQPTSDDADGSAADDTLRLIFTCAHPALAPEAQVALTLRTVCGLSTEQLASAFLVPAPTLAKRLGRTKQRIRDAGIPYRVPPIEEFPERLDAVLLVVYLVFNEGYKPSAGEAWLRPDLCREAIRLGRLLCELLPAGRDARGLLALMLLHDSRRAARVDADGDLVVLDEQDRSLWNREQIRDGLALVASALRDGPPGPDTLQAAVAALHAEAPRAADTDWEQIAALDDVLMRTHPSPVIELNHAAAVAMVDGPLEGLRRLDALERRGELRWLLPASRGARRSAAPAGSLGRCGGRVPAGDRALVTNHAEQRFFTRHLHEAEEGARAKH